MKALALAICVGAAACGGKEADKAVDQYINKDFAMTHSRIVGARTAYSDIKATDIDEPGKLAYLKFRINDIAVPFLAQALDEAKTFTAVPEGARSFHERTVALLPTEHAALAEMGAALAPPDAAKFKAAHEKMMDMQQSVFTWEEVRNRMLVTAKVKLGPLPKVPIPEQKPETAAEPPKPAEPAAPPP